jgi:hypothetical protein
MRQADPRTKLAAIEAPLLDPNRRLADKIFTAFSQAYAMGASQVAHRLRQALAEAQVLDPGSTGERRGGNLLEQADLWTGFVDARSAYNEALANGAAAPETVRQALAAMRAAHDRWSAS